MKESNIDLFVEEIKESVELESMAYRSMGWAALLLPTPAVRRQLFLCTLILVSFFGSGMETMQYYLFDVLEAAGVTSTKTANDFLVAFGVVKLVAMIIGARLLDALGRRVAIFLSLTGSYHNLLY